MADNVRFLVSFALPLALSFASVLPSPAREEGSGLDSPARGEGKSASSPESPSLLDPSSSPPGEMRPATPAGEDVGRPSSDRDVLGSVVRDMRASERLLRQQQQGVPTRDVQQRIVDTLGELVNQLQRQKGGDAKPQSARSQAATTSPAPTEGQPRASSQAGERNSGGNQEEKPVSPQDLVEKVWGQLPPRMQQQIGSPVHEQFLPQYEPLIIEYYRRLAEENQK